MQRKPFALDQALFTFFVFDTLFIPLFLPVPLPLSFVILPIWMFAIPRMPPRQTVLWSLIGIGFATLSYIHGYDYTINDLVDNLPTQRIANTAIVVVMFSAYALGMATRFRDFTTIARLFRIYLIFVLVLAVIFFVSVGDYFTVRSFWSFSNVDEFVTQLNTVTRFTGTMSDPNNFAVSTCAITAFLVFFDAERMGRNVVAIGITALAVVASMSVEGVICFAILLASFIVGSRMPSGTKALLIFATAVTGLGIFLAIRDTEVFRFAMDRVRDSDADSRYSRWARALDAGKFISSLIIGDGGTILLAGQDYRPHNGHIHLMYSFGLPCYIAFMAVFFRVRNITNWRHYVFLAILFIGFTINVGIYEYRFAGVWVALLVMYHRIDAQRAHHRSTRPRVDRTRHAPANIGGMAKSAAGKLPTVIAPSQDTFTVPAPSVVETANSSLKTGVSK